MCIQSLKGRKFLHMLQHGWTLKTLYQVELASYKKIKLLWFLLYEVSRIFKFIETESGTVFEKSRELLFKGCWISVLQNERRSGDGEWW